MSSDHRKSWRIPALKVLFANVVGKVMKPLILAIINDYDYPIVLRMLYTFTNGGVDWYLCFLLDVVQFFILSTTIFSVLKEEICPSKLLVVILFLLLESYFILGALFKLHITDIEDLKTTLRCLVDVIFVDLYMITVLVFKIFSVFIIYKFFKWESNREPVGKMPNSPSHPLPACRAVHCEEGNENVPPALTPSAPPLDEVCTLPQMDPLIPSTSSV